MTIEYIPGLHEVTKNGRAIVLRFYEHIDEDGLQVEDRSRCVFCQAAAIQELLKDDEHDDVTESSC